MPPRPKTSDQLLPDGADQETSTLANTKTNEKVSVKNIGSTSSVEKTPSVVSNQQCDEKTSKNEPESILGKFDEKTSKKEQESRLGEFDGKTSEKEPESRLGEFDIWEKTQMEKTKER